MSQPVMTIDEQKMLWWKHEVDRLREALIDIADGCANKRELAREALREKLSPLRRKK